MANLSRKEPLEETFEEALKTLNGFYAEPGEMPTRAERSQVPETILPAVLEAAAVAGVSPERLDRLSVIHVSGTKGKGSTCCMCESILRTHGYTTGFFSSPHLVNVCERMRINGQTISKENFNKYFWECYRLLDKARNDKTITMPYHFRFFTIMALYVFLEEKVDVAILEVGLGGEYDCTNIIRSPVVCGVTSLGIDHTDVLGDTLEKIAWHKAGIFKNGVPALTVPQDQNAMAVLRARATEKGIPLFIVPDLTQYDWGEPEVSLGIKGVMQTINASLAIQLCHIWMQDHQLDLNERMQKYSIPSPGGGDAGQSDPVLISHAPIFPITEHVRKGLSTCRWPGRSQVLRQDNITYYMDGAHTHLSLQACVKWFISAANDQVSNCRGRVARVLLFSVTGGRSSVNMLKQLLPCHFDCAIFCPAIANCDVVKRGEIHQIVNVESLIADIIKVKNEWIHLLSANNGAKMDVMTSRNDESRNDKVPMTQGLKSLDEKSQMTEGDQSMADSELKQRMPTYVFHSIEESHTWLTRGGQSGLDSKSVTMATYPGVLMEADHIQVLVTGSLHLVGGLLGLIQPQSL